MYKSDKMLSSAITPTESPPHLNQSSLLLIQIFPPTPTTYPAFRDSENATTPMPMPMPMLMLMLMPMIE